MINPADAVRFVWTWSSSIWNRPSVCVLFTGLNLIISYERGTIVIFHAFISFVVENTMGLHRIWTGGFIHEYNFNDVTNFGTDVRSEESQMYFPVASFLLMIKCAISKLSIYNFLVDCTKESAVGTCIQVRMAINVKENVL